MGKTKVADALATAARTRDDDHLGDVLCHYGNQMSTEDLQRVFREEVPCLLEPLDLLWLLRRITQSDAEFERRRDVMLDSLTADLVACGFEPGVHFSLVPDKDAGRAVLTAEKVWQRVKSSLTIRAIQHFRCFVRTPSTDGKSACFASA